jgi:hypothetical protein
VIPALLVLGSIATNAVILLSDRAPGLLRRVSDRIDGGRGAGAADVARAHISADSDFAVHVMIWTVAAVLVGLAAWSWLSMLLGGAALFASSVALEGAQHFVTTTRVVQAADVAGNALGVAAGVTLVTAFALAWRATSAVLGSR